MINLLNGDVVKLATNASTKQPHINDTYINDTHGEKPPLNKALTLSKSMFMEIWGVGTSNRIFKRGS